MKEWKRLFIMITCVIMMGCGKKEEEIVETVETVQEIFETEESEETETEEAKIYCEKTVDIAKLKEEQNSDIYAWITIPGTKVDYPVLQSEEDNYYLNRNLDLSEGYPGGIYSNACNSKSFDDFNTILYGHKMKNGTMFGSLYEYRKEDFFKENRYIYVYTEEKRLTYRVCANVNYNDYYIPSLFDFDTEEGKQEYLDSILTGKAETDRRDPELAMTEDDRYLTLATCIPGQSDGRFLVIGMLVQEAWYE